MWWEKSLWAIKKTKRRSKKEMVDENNSATKGKAQS